MQSSIEVNVTIQLESFGNQVTRGRPIGPWSVQAVGANPTEVLRKLQRKLTKQLPKSPPTTFFEGSLPPEFENWSIEVELPPQERGLAWQDPIRMQLDCFRWQLPSGHIVVRIPAVGCNLFGKLNELDEVEIQTQATVSLIRLAEDQNLLQLRQAYQDRSYDFQCIRVRVPLSEEQEKQAKQKSVRGKTATLRSTASDLTAAKLPPVFGVDDQARELADHFEGEHPQSVLLVGPSGVGKSALVHQMVHLRSNLGLGQRKVWSTSGARIVSGMSGLGMWQERCSKLIKEASATDAILHLGSLFELMEAGKIDSSPGVASMVRQAINRRRLVAIAECTPEQLAIIERDDPMLLRAFSRMELKEPPARRVKQILRESADSTGAKDLFSDGAIEELYRLHARFATYSALPATAIRLMRSMEDASQPDRIYESHDVARAFAKQTGLPRFLVDDSVQLDLDKVRSALVQNVIGQEEPVELIVNLIATLKARLVRPGKPLATLMFIGPTGVGKTEMAKTIAHLLYSDTQRMIRIDMSEYSSPWSTHKLIGKPGEGDGALTSPIREQPFSVVLLDEFEKADSNVFDLLLQLLGEGRLTDSQGRLADFRNAVVIMTSNLGVETFRESNFGFGNDDTSGWREHFHREVRKFVRPEFLGRIDRIVPFQPLPREVVRRIAQRELEKLKQRAGLKFSDSELSISPETVERLSEIGYQPNYGARPLRRAIEEHVTIPLANELSNHRQSDHKLQFHVHVRQDEIVVETEKLEAKSASIKDREAQIINTWQAVAAMARSTLTSGPMRNLENELERTVRQNELLRKKMKMSEGRARVANLKERLHYGETAIEKLKKLKRKMNSVVEEISQQQLSLMLAWYQNDEIDWEHFQEESKTARSRLRQATEDLVEGRLTSSNLVTMLVQGEPAQVEILWKAYQKIAAENRWNIDVFLAKKYDPLRDPNSSEFRKRSSERKMPALDEASRPTRRLHSPGDNPVKRCDLYRIKEHEVNAAALAGCVGFAVQVLGEGVASWLDNEAGVIHFFDPREAGAKRRIRCKVMVANGRPADFALSEDWQELVAAPDRDPLRTFFVDEGKIADATDRRISYAKGKASATYAQLMTEDHERALWLAIGYNGIPAEARLLSRSEQPGSFDPTLSTI